MKTIEKKFDSNIDEKTNNKVCSKCKEDFIYKQEETWWNEQGMSSVKLVKCPYCGCIQAIKFGELHDVNKDARYYK